MINAFLAFAEKCEIPFHGDLNLNTGSKPQRWCKDRTSKKDEWLFSHSDENTLLVTLGSWSTNQKFVFKSWEHIAGSPKPTYDYEAIQQMHTEEIIKQHEEAAKAAKQIWEDAEPCITHPYLERKKVKPFGIKVKDGNLIIPIYNFKGNLSSLQRIRPDGKKRFLSGGKISSCFLILGQLEQAPSAFICEGFATGSSIHEATGKPVIIAFSGGQILPVAFILKERHPETIIYNCGDIGQVGNDNAAKLMETLKISTYFPKFDKDQVGDGFKDFNDLSYHKGLDEVFRQLKPKRYHGLPLEDLIIQNVDPMEWAIENLFIRGSLNLIYADTGVGKSRLCYTMAYCAAMGYDFLHRKIPKPMKTCYIDAEMTQQEVITYSKWMMEAYHDTPEDNMITFLTNHMIIKDKQQPINLYNADSRSKLDPMIEEHEFIVLDNFSHLTQEAQLEDENKSGSWTPISTWLKNWTEKGKTIVLIHHAGKSGKARGTSRMLVDARTILKLEPSKQSILEEIRKKELKEAFLDLSVDVIYEKARHLPGKLKKTKTFIWFPYPEGKREPWFMITKSDEPTAQGKFP